ncbi:MAG: hypothetical protein JRG96_12910 [Deltaproteobacteria bacterium]|nr:hypothetical protein [Deltaproteobacteria bacterium]
MAKLQIDPTGPIPTIRVHVGRAQLGNYTFGLWDAQGRNPRVSGQGVNTDDIEDVFRIVASRKELLGLNRHILDGVIWVKALKKGKKRYAIEVEIKQGELQLASWKDSGEMTTSMKNLKNSWTIELS